MAGASGQVDLNPGIDTEQPEGTAVGDHDARPNVPATGQQHGPNAPSHGAAGGHDEGWATRPGATPAGPVRPQTGLKDPVLGG